MVLEPGSRRLMAAAIKTNDLHVKMSLTNDTELRIRGGSTAVESIGLIPAYVVFSFRLRSRLFVVLYLTARWRLVESTTKQTEM